MSIKVGKNGKMPLNYHMVYSGSTKVLHKHQKFGRTVYNQELQETITKKKNSASNVRMGMLD